MARRVAFPYGRGYLSVELPDDAYIVSSKLPRKAEVDQSKLVEEALENPISAPPLSHLVGSGSRVCILVTDKTRATPNRRILPILLSKLGLLGVKREDLMIIVANGLHKPESRVELEELLGSRVCSEYCVVNHVAEDEDSLVYLGRTRFGTEVYVNRLVLEADLKIAVGLVEPHFFAGYSGGRKLVLPGVSGVRSVYGNHGFRMVAHPKADYGILEGNPIHEDMVEAARMAKLNYAVNVILGRDKSIIYASSGDPFESHREAVAKLDSMVKVEVPFQADVVIVSNGGYPLDRNLYQAVKGMATGARIVRRGGVIVVSAECCDGVGHKEFQELASLYRDPAKILEYIRENEPLRDQWEVQKLAQILGGSRVILVSKGVRQEEAEAMNLGYASSLEEALSEALRMTGGSSRIAAVPEGPYVIPYVKG